MVLIMVLVGLKTSEPSSNVWYNANMKRPTLYDACVTQTVVDRMMPRIIEWLKSGGWDEKDLDDEYLSACRKDFVRAIDYIDDALEICHSLRDWAPDDDFIEIARSVSDVRYDVHRELVATWATVNDVKPAFVIGDVVEFTDHLNAKMIGEITKVDLCRAQYCIFCESKGHVRKGTGTHGVFVAFEDVKEKVDD